MWLAQGDRSGAAFSTPAFRTAHPLNDIDQPGLPTGNVSERLRIAFPNVAARAREDQKVLPEVIV